MSDKFAGGIKAGSAGVTLPVVLTAADGSELTAIAATAVTASYWRQGGVPTAIAVVALGSTNAAWAAGGWFEKDATLMPGSYRLDAPDAAFAAGADWVLVAAKTSTSRAFYSLYALESKGAAEVSAQVAALPTAPTASAVASATATAIQTGSAPTWYAAPPGVPAIVAGVWDEAQAGHSTPGSFGDYLDSAISGISAGGSGSAPTADEVAAAVAAIVIEAAAGNVPAINLGQALALILAPLAGQHRAMKTTAPYVTNPGGTVTRIQHNLDADGNSVGSPILILPT